MMRDRFTFYRSFSEAIIDLPDTDRLVIYEAITAFSLDHTEPKLSGVPKIVWMLIRPVLEANWIRYENGVNGGAPQGNANASKTTKKQPKTTDALSVKEERRDKRVEYKRDNSATFVAPSLSDLESFITEKGYAIDAQRFLDFYESKGWMIGKNKMKDWRAAVRTWTHRPDQTPNTTTHETTAGKYFDE